MNCNFKTKYHKRCYKTNSKKTISLICKNVYKNEKDEKPDMKIVISTNKRFTEKELQVINKPWHQSEHPEQTERNAKF